MYIIIKKRTVILLFILFIFYGMLMGPSNMYAEEQYKEYNVKAAFLLKFTEFIRWPSHILPDPHSLITICILGNDPFGASLKTIDGKLVIKRKWIVKKVSNVEDIGECHILFVARSERKNLTELLTKTKDMPILTVADMENFCRYGGIINFINVKQNIRFEINNDAAQRAGLSISSKLLRLSKIIKER